jgi:hypothetical protein
MKRMCGRRCGCASSGAASEGRNALRVIGMRAS